MKRFQIVDRTGTKKYYNLEQGTWSENWQDGTILNEGEVYQTRRYPAFSDFEQVPTALVQFKNYMSAEVFRPANGSDCTINGVTSRFTEVLCYWGKIEDLTEQDLYIPNLLIFKVRERGIAAGHKYFVPAEVIRKKQSSMFGSNFVFASDGRFRTHISDYPVSVHDRVESY